MKKFKRFIGRMIRTLRGAKSEEEFNFFKNKLEEKTFGKWHYLVNPSTCSKINNLVWEKVDQYHQNFD